MLADAIRKLRDRTLFKLNAAYDYYENTQIAWQLALSSIAGGYSTERQSEVTGNITTPADLANLDPGTSPGN